MTDNIQEPAYFQELIQRLKSHIQNKTTDIGSKTFSHSVDRYYRTDIYEKEMQWLKSSMPIAIGGAHTLKHEGDYFTCEVLGYPLLVTKAAGNIKAFLNICKHRAAQLVSCPKGNIDKITCPYHGWTYQLDGQLSSITGGECGTKQLCMDKIQLIELPHYISAGIIWVILEGAEKNENLLAKHFKALEEEFTILDFNNYTPSTHFELECDFNWKIAIESFLETYHFAYVHANSITGQEFQNIALFDQLEMHGRIVIPMNSFKNLLESNSESLLLPHVNIMYFIFPNNFLLVMRGFFAWISVIPTEAEKCIIKLNMMVPANCDDESLLERAQMSTAGLKHIIQEDIAICNALQKNIQCKQVVNLNYTQFEVMIEHFHQWLI